MKRTPFKRKNVLIKSRKKPSIRIRPITEQEKEEAVALREKDMEFYNRIWNKRPHKCEVCGKELGNELSTGYMDHLLEKSSYPDLRHEEDNIIVVCLDCHYLKTNGFPKPLHQEAIEKAKERFL